MLDAAAMTHHNFPLPYILPAIVSRRSASDVTYSLVVIDPDLTAALIDTTPRGVAYCLLPKINLVLPYLFKAIMVPSPLCPWVQSVHRPLHVLSSTP